MAYFPVQAKGVSRGEEYLPRPAELPVGSELELRVYWALKRLNVAFVPQIEYEGGQGYPGGTRVDFQLLDRPMVIYVHGPYYHDSAYSQARDIVNEMALKAQGMTPVIIWWYELEGVRAEDVVLQKIGYVVGARREWHQSRSPREG